MLWVSTQRFFIIFFGSCIIGVIGALTTAFVLKYLDFKKNPSLEISLMFISSYIPYTINTNSGPRRLIATEEPQHQFVELISLFPLRPMAAFIEEVDVLIGHILKAEGALW